MGKRILDTVGQYAIALFVIIAGIASTAFCGSQFLQSLAVRMWDGYECEVVDLRIETVEPNGKVWTRGQYDVRFDLRELTTGTDFRNMPATAPRPEYHDEYQLQTAILPATPGAIVDCWINPAATVAYIRRPPRFVVGTMFFMTALSVMFALSGVIVLRPSLLDRIGNATARVFRRAAGQTS